MKINYFDPSELSEPPKAEDFLPHTDIRGYHNYVWVSATEHDLLYHYICTRCGSRASLPQEADAFPPNEGECVRVLQMLKKLNSERTEQYENQIT